MGVPPPTRHASIVDRLAGVLLVAALAAAGGWLAVPSGAVELPGTDQLGRPAVAPVRADRDYRIIDARETARRRAAAVAASRPVFDQDEAGAGDAAARLHAAFALMREVEGGLDGRRPPADRAERRRVAVARRESFVGRLQLVVDDGDLAALADAGFSEEVEGDLAALTAAGLDGMVVADVALLPEDRDGGFTVRSLRGGEVVGERQVADRAAVRDLATARAAVARAAARRLTGLPAPLRAVLLRLALAAVRPTLVHDQAETARRRTAAAARVEPAVIALRRGERVVAAGELIEPRHLAVFAGMRARRAGEDPLRSRAAGASLVSLLVLTTWLYGRRALPAVRTPLREQLVLALLVAGVMGTAAGGLALADLALDRWPGLPPAGLGYLLPTAAAALLARELVSGEAGALVAIVAGLATGLVAAGSFPLALHAAVTSLAAAAAGGGPRDRRRGVAVGLATGAAGAALAAALAIVAGRSAAEWAGDAGAALVGGGLLVPLVAAAVRPLLAPLPGAVSGARLRALGSLNHPALKELIVQAPGTYHHAILVGTLAEAAAVAIGADALLARVGAYFHDLGKLRAPLLFAENQRGRNEHEGLRPADSALAVKRHVSDGLELARQWRLPAAVTAFIAEHHGTRLVTYFWAKQRQLADAGGAEVADEGAFRYPGPIPRSREVALVMLADACEASARALVEPEPAALRALVDQRFSEVARDGQLEDCDLTLRDLRAAAGAMAGALEELYRARPAGERGRPRVALVEGGG